MAAVDDLRGRGAPAAALESRRGDEGGRQLMAAGHFGLPCPFDAARA